MILRIATLALFACATQVMAQADVRLLTEDWPADIRSQTSADLSLFSRSHLSSGGSTQFSQLSAEGRVRVNTDDPISPSLGYAWSHFELSKGTLLPGQLDDVSFEAAAPITATGSAFFGLGAGIGYAGDGAFAHSDSIYAKADAVAGFDLGGQRSLVVTLNYDGNRTLLPDVPLPFIEYSATFGDQIEYTLGFPASSLTWHATDRLDLRASYLFPTDIELEALYQFMPSLSAYARYFTEEEAFHLDQLPRDRRLFYDDQRVEAGLTVKPLHDLDWNLSAAIGYAFDRKFQTGFDDRNLHTNTDLESQLYLRLQLSLDF